MSIFEISEKDIEDYENWMDFARNEISRNVGNKTSFYSFDFNNSEPMGNGKFCWEKPKEPSKRMSTLRVSMRSSLSTLPTLGEELTEDIPRISDLDQRISQELIISPIVLLPHKR